VLMDMSVRGASSCETICTLSCWLLEPHAGWSFNRILSTVFRLAREAQLIKKARPI